MRMSWSDTGLGLVIGCLKISLRLAKWSNFERLPVIEQVSHFKIPHVRQSVQEMRDTDTLTPDELLRSTAQTPKHMCIDQTLFHQTHAFDPNALCHGNKLFFRDFSS